MTFFWWSGYKKYMDIKQFEVQNNMKKIVHANSYRPRL
nr:MAG TPA: hypothetical protein [Caudoviricetes sp.]